MLRYLLLIIVFFFVTNSYTQTSFEDKIYKAYDDIVGLDNTGLYNGTEFTDLFVNTNGTYRYLEGFDYSKGSIIYKGEYYVDVLLKYDLLEDNLLSRSDDKLGAFNIKLIPEFVSEFSIHGRYFVRMTDKNANGFFELAFQGNHLDLFIKHKKKKRDRPLKSGVQYSFKPINFYLFKYQNDYIKVESIRDVRRAFPMVKTQIKDFYRIYKILYNKNRDGFMTKLTDYLDSLPELDKM